MRFHKFQLSSFFKIFTMETKLNYKQIKIFVSSTFVDMQDERNRLTYKVFPEHKHWCAVRGFDLVDIDLRWGISLDESAGGKVLEICLNEVKNTTPFFMGIVGDRYGWIPSRNDIDSFERVEDICPSIGRYLDEKYSITEMEMMLGVLESERDYNAIFFIRKPKCEDLSENGVRLEQLRVKIKAQSRYPVFEYSSLDEFEVLVRSFFRDKLASMYSNDLDEDIEFAKMQNIYHNTLLFNYTPISRQISYLDDFMSADKSVLVFDSHSGFGRTSLLAYYASLVRAKGGDWRLISFFRDAVVDDIEGTYMYLRNQLYEALDYPEAERVTHRLKVTQKEKNLIVELLHEAKKRDKKLLLMLDVSSEKNFPLLFSSVLFDEKYDNVKIIVTVDGYAADDTYLYGGEVLPLDTAEKHLLINTYLKHYSKALPKAYLTDMIAESAISSPKYLKLLLDELRKYGSFDGFAEYLKVLLDASEAGCLLSSLLDLWAKEYDDVGCVFVKDFFYYLSISPYFTEGDMLGVLKIPAEKHYMFYSFFRACSFAYKVIGRYLAPAFKLAELRDDYIYNNVQQEQQEKLMSYFVNNHTMHPDTFRSHIFTVPNSIIRPYFEEYREKIESNTLLSSELVLAEAIMCAFDTFNDDLYSLKNYYAMTCVSKIMETDPTFIDRLNYYPHIYNWLRIPAPNENDVQISDYKSLRQQMGLLFKDYVMQNAQNSELLYTLGLNFVDYAVVIREFMNVEDKGYLTLLENLYLLYIDRRDDAIYLDELCTVLASIYHHHTQNPIFKTRVVLQSKKVKVPFL